MLNRRIARLRLLGTLAPHERARALRAEPYVAWLLFAFALLWIPAFYLELGGASRPYWAMGRWLYLAVFLAYAAAAGWHIAALERPARYFSTHVLDAIVPVCALAAAAWYADKWNGVQWFLQMSFAGLIAARLALPLLAVFTPHRIVLLLCAGALSIAVAGEGFYLLEPSVHSYADGLWLAFESGATVGYGDIAPSTPASRVFAMFVILIGYGMLTLVFAAIAARFVGQEERRLRHEMHRDIKVLCEEVAKLRAAVERAGLTSAPGPDARPDEANDGH